VPTGLESGRACAETWSWSKCGWQQASRSVYHASGWKRDGLLLAGCQPSHRGSRGKAVSAGARGAQARAGSPVPGECLELLVEHCARYHARQPEQAQNSTSSVTPSNFWNALSSPSSQLSCCSLMHPRKARGCSDPGNSPTILSWMGLNAST
jgi:hypothetical protein